MRLLSTKLQPILSQTSEGKQENDSHYNYDCGGVDHCSANYRSGRDKGIVSDKGFVCYTRFLKQFYKSTLDQADEIPVQPAPMTISFPNLPINNLTNYSHPRKSLKMKLSGIFLFLTLLFLLHVSYQRAVRTHHSHNHHPTSKPSSPSNRPAPVFELSVRLPIDPVALQHISALIDELVTVRHDLCGIHEIKGWELDPATATTSDEPPYLPNNARTVWKELFIWLERRGGKQTALDALEELQLELRLTKSLCTPSKVWPGGKYKVRFGRWLLSKSTSNMVYLGMNWESQEEEGQVRGGGRKEHRISLKNGWVKVKEEMKRKREKQQQQQKTKEKEVEWNGTYASW